MSNQEIASLAPRDDEEGLRTLVHNTEGLQRGDRKSRALETGSGTRKSPVTSARASPFRPGTPARGGQRLNYTNQSPSTPTNRRKAGRSSLQTHHRAKSASRVQSSTPKRPRQVPSRPPSSSSHTANHNPNLHTSRQSATNPSDSTASHTHNQTPKTPDTQAVGRNMSSNSRRGPTRNGTRGGSDDNVINRPELNEDVRRAVAIIAEGERKAKVLKDKIILLEQRMRKKKDDGTGVPVADLTELEALYREEVKIAEEQKIRASDESLLTRIRLLADVQSRAEQEDGQMSARNSNSRTAGAEFDGPSDSPVPSPADNRHIRKVGGSRTSSQPPRSNTDKLDGTASEASERASKPKIMYSFGEEVAFKRKLPGGKPEDQDWIQGEVVRVIGEGKSRRYDVKDIDPDAVGGNNIYKSSASQMVPIPPEGTPLGDYEPGKQVLALYPAATTFYRAQVKSMVDGGARVLVLFEEEDVEKSIARRFVLDHKG